MKDNLLEYVILLLILIYSIILSFCAEGNIEILKGAIILSFGCFLIPVLIIGLNKHFSLNEIERLVVKVGVSACIISSICFIFPELNNLLKNLQFLPSDNLVGLSFRGFGISNGLFFYYPIVLSVILIIYLENRGPNFRKIFIGVLFLFSIFINARIGLVPLVLSCILKCFKNLKKLLGITLILLSSIIVIWYIGDKFSETTIGFICRWILGGVGQITNPILGTNFETFGENHLETLGESGILFPEGIENIFGTGINLFGRTSGDHTDMGYMVQYYYGGIIVSSLILGLIFTMGRNLFKWLSVFPSTRNLVIFIFVGTVAISNFKGDLMFQMNSGFLFLFFCYVQIKLYARKKTFIHYNSGL